MTRYLWAAATAAVVAAVGVAADPPKDTKAAEYTRTKKLKGRVTVEAKNTPLGDILKDISDQLDQDRKLGPLSVAYDIGISKNTRTSLAVKDVAADEALDQLLKSLGYGYVVVSKDKDRYDGWIKLVKGDARGYEPGTEPKDAPKPGAKPPTTPAKPDEKKPDPPKPDSKPDEKKPADPAAAEEEKTARGKLDSAKKLIADGKPADARPLLKYVVKFHPATASAAEAKKLLDEMK